MTSKAAYMVMIYNDASWGALQLEFKPLKQEKEPCEMIGLVFAERLFGAFCGENPISSKS
jgi:hypothetical protein